MKMNFPAPEIVTKESDVGIMIAGMTVWLSDIEVVAPKHPEILGRPLQRVALYVLKRVCFSSVAGVREKRAGGAGAFSHAFFRKFSFP